MFHLSRVGHRPPLRPLTLPIKGPVTRLSLGHTGRSACRSGRFLAGLRPEHSQGHLALLPWTVPASGEGAVSGRIHHPTSAPGGLHVSLRGLGLARLFLSVFS